MRACELAMKLAEDAENVAKFMLPKGKRMGHEWVAGDVDGSDGKSLKVVVMGGKSGVWKDFASDEGGDLIGLWMATKKCDLRTACQEAMRYLGIEEARVEPQEKRSWSKPSREGVGLAGEPITRWLRSVRKLTDRSILAYKIAAKKGALMFPYLRDNELVFAKYRAIPEKKFWTDANCEPVLFGWQAIPGDAREVTLCEGELDAMSLFEYGWPALSVPFGGGGKNKQAWIENEFDRLAVFDTVYLALDDDGPGREAMQEIVRRLGRERCRIVRLPAKDANECLKNDVDGEEIERCFRDAQTLDPELLKRPMDFKDGVLREFAMQDQGEPGIRLPWRKIGSKLILRAGEVSVWAGMTAHGKSEIAGHVVLESMTQDYRTCVASMEFKPPKWLKRIVRQATALAFPTQGQILHVLNWLNPRMLVFNTVGTTKVKEVLETFGYAAKRYGVQLFVIDNLAKCGIDEEDYKAQKNFVDALCDLSKEHDCHIMLLAHMRKPQGGEDKPPERSDVKGTGALTDMVDTVVIIWRNKPKERKKAKGDYAAESEDPDCILVCGKQRNGESEPRIKLWFDLKSHQYLEEHDQVASPIVGLRSVQSEMNTGE